MRLHRGVTARVMTLVVVLVSSIASAERVVALPPLEIVSNQYDKDSAGRNAQGSHGTVTYTLSNLSDVEQTITVRMKSIQVSNSFCLAATPPSPGGTWGAPNGNCYGNTHTIADLSTTLTLGAKASTKTSWVVICDWTTGGPSCASGGPRNNINWQLGGTSFRMSFASEISVQQDRGAVIASLYGEGFLWLGYTQVAPYLNSLVNGGRPF